MYTLVIYSIEAKQLVKLKKPSAKSFSPVIERYIKLQGVDRIVIKDPKNKNIYFHKNA